MESVNSEQAEFWSALAPSWLELEDQLELISGLPGQIAMDQLSLENGQRVIDLGCGTGSTTLELAARVGPEGEVVGVDIADEMLAAGRQRVQRKGVSNVRFLQADAQSQDLGDGRFDAAFSRFGVMFFADPQAAFSNVRRAMRSEGRLCFVCWQSPFENDWMLVPATAAMSVLGPLPVPEPDAPGPFSLADPARVRTILEGSGFDQVEVMARNDVVTIDEDRIPQVVQTSTRVGIVRYALREVDEETRSKVLAAVEEALRTRVQDGEVRSNRGFNVVSARA